MIHPSREQMQIRFSIYYPCGDFRKTKAYQSFVMVSSVKTVVNQLPEGFCCLNVKNRR